MSEWWRGAVTYQIYPRSYQDSTGNGNGIGDLPGITARLPYIADLGVDAIWLSPIFTSPMADMGYDVANYTDIDPCFGTLADFDALIACAHELGLKVIIDQVLSHSSNQHPFFQESRQSRDNPKADWYVWEWNPYAMQYHIFSKNQPENLPFLERMRALLDEYPDRAMVGEMGESHHAIRMMGEYTTGKRLHMCYSFEMLDTAFSAAHFRQQIEEFFTDAPHGWPCWAFSNHDVVRHVSRWAAHGASQDALAKQASALLLSLQGSICLYQGEELGQTESDLEYHELTDPQGIRFWPESKGRDGCRTPMVWDASQRNTGFSTGKPWLPINAPQMNRHVAGQVGKADSVLAFYKQMLTLRRSSEALQHGNSVFFDTAEPILAFTRGDNILCVFNLSPQAQTVQVQGTLDMALSAAAQLSDTTLALDANGVAIFYMTGDVSVA